MLLTEENIFEQSIISPLLSFLGYYTCVEVIFTLRRQVGFYMMGVYAPTLLIVVLSWLSFWINPDASAARVPLGECHKYTIYILCLHLFILMTIHERLHVAEPHHVEFCNCVSFAIFIYFCPRLTRKW